jgi:diguanylate cyclase (GGDEF)-like protein
LRTVAERLRLCLRASDTLARFGDDEFAMIQPTLPRAEDADALARRLLAAMDPPIDLDGQFQHVGLSIGVSPSEMGVPMQSEQLMKQDDTALYQAKRGARGRVCFLAPEMNVKLPERHAVETDLRAAIADQT